MEKLGVSIVVPVYNVEKYLEQCLESLCNQRTTFEYEIIVVNDGSTDSCGEICERWARQYKQIQYYKKENEGLGPTRNFGMKHAAYRYVAFVDSDDWIHESFVEKMVNCIWKNDADIAYCDCYYYNDAYQSVTHAYFRSNLQNINAQMEERMAFGYPNMWGAIYRKDLWENSDLRMPEIIYEDTAVYGVLLAFVGKICCVSDALYYYRVGRSGSLMQIGSKDPQNMVNALTHLINLAKEKAVLHKHSNAFLDFCVRQLESEWDSILRKSDEQKLEKTKEKFDCFLSTSFPQWEKLYCQTAVAIGSYNACAIFNRVKMFRTFSQDKYQFSSLISIMSAPVSPDRYSFNETASRFRLEILKKEIEGKCLDLIGENRIIVLDFLDEWNDIIKVEDAYLNKTDALCEAVNLYGKIEIIPRDSMVCMNIWKESCKRFVHWAKQNNNQIVLLKLYMCTEYGYETSKHPFAYQKWIEEKNRMLRDYYSYFEEICPECLVIELKPEYEFTEEHFRFGCKPYYYNSFAYYLLAYEVLRKVRELKGYEE